MSSLGSGTCIFPSGVGGFTSTTSPATRTRLTSFISGMLLSNVILTVGVVPLRMRSGVMVACGCEAQASTTVETATIESPMAAMLRRSEVFMFVPLLRVEVYGHENGQRRLQE